ncbi:MAG: flagellar biosynthetic protein FliR [Bacillota bacterium]
MDLILIRAIYHSFLIMMRITGLFMIAPFYGSNIIPKRIKVAASFLLTLILRNTVDNNLELPTRILSLALNAISELSIGFILGFVTFLVFVVVQLAGQMISMRMGLAMANIMDPQNGSSVAVIGELKNVLATLLFLVIDGHHHLLRVLQHSFELVPLTSFSFSDGLFRKLLRIIGDIFPMAFQIALPVIVILFLTDVAFGLVARAVPQINVFIMGLPTKLLVGTFILFITVPIYFSVLKSNFRELFTHLDEIITILAQQGG